MFPRPFEFVRAGSVQEATAILAQDDGAKVIAGGQSLIPMLSLGLAAPTCLIDITGLELDGIEIVDGLARVGALTRHRELERSAHLRSVLPLAAEAAAFIGNPRVRNRGTFGGSLSHADPTAELCAVALAHGGRVVLSGPRGERTVGIEEFVVGYFETAAEPDELLVRAELELPPAGSGTAFIEVAERDGDFATAGAAAIVTLDATGTRCEHARVVVIGIHGLPVRVAEVEDLCAGEAVTESLLDAAAAAVERAAMAEDDPFISAQHRVRCARACTKRAVSTAFARARGEHP